MPSTCSRVWDYSTFVYLSVSLSYVHVLVCNLSLPVFRLVTGIPAGKTVW